MNQQHINGAVIMARHYMSSPCLFDECRLSAACERFLLSDVIAYAY